MEVGVAVTFIPGICWISFFTIAAYSLTPIFRLSFETSVTVISLLFFSDTPPVNELELEFPIFEKTFTTSGFFKSKFSTF
ncbi:hypothetical protein SDC9_134261 [bioreactor metagenome]|uniref:Uncharacterized protein n=1 Tax=bioreactor metagenome TaxID=1076179 RepID=A0A645DD62_9ZZZZ